MSGLRATYAQLTPDLRGFSPTKDDSSTMSQDTILKSDFTPTRNHKKTMVCRHIISCKKSTYATTYAVCFPTTSSPPTYADLRISGFYLRARFLWPPPFLPQHGGFIEWLRCIMYEASEYSYRAPTPPKRNVAKSVGNPPDFFCSIIFSMISRITLFFFLQEILTWSVFFLLPKFSDQESFPYHVVIINHMSIDFLRRSDHRCF